MSGVRLLVGTRKGAFVLTADGTRRQWQVAGPHFAGWELYHLKGSPADPNRLYASQSSGWFGQLIQRSDDGGETLDAGEQCVRLRRRARDAPVVRRHAASVGVQAGVAPRAVADRSGRGLCRRRGCRAVQDRRRRAVLAGVARIAGARLRAALAAGRRRVVPAHGHPRSVRSAAHLRRDLRRRGVPQRRRRGDVEGDQPRPEVRRHSRSRCRGRALRASHRDAPVTAERAVHAEALGRDAQPRRAASRGTKSAATCRPTSASRSTCTPTSRRRSTSCRSPATPCTFRPDGRLRVYRSRTGGDEWEPLAAGLPQENCYVNVLRDAMSVDTLDSCGIYFGTTGGQVYASTDAGDTWTAIVHDLPPVLSIEAQTLR